MKYFIDTEFIEGTQSNKLLSISIGKTKPTIDLISIGIVAEDGKEYYAISKDFNLKEAWNRYQIKQVSGDMRNIYPEGIKEYWIRDNVLKPIFDEWNKYSYHSFTYGNMKYCINCIGKTNKQIANEVKAFVYKPFYNEGSDNIEWVGNKSLDIQFYGYYSDYDWVVFCWLFGKMIDLPKGFPMYCIDLKQILDEKCLYDIYICKYKTVVGLDGKSKLHIDDPDVIMTLEKYKKANTQERLSIIKSLSNYPKQSNEHNALDDAKWDFKLFNFLNTI